MQTKVFYCCTVLKATSRRIYTTARCQDMTATFTDTHVSVRYARSCQSPPLKLIKTKKNTNLLLLCVHAHREAHSIGLLRAWSTRSRALIAHRAKEIRPPQDHLIPKCIQISIIIMCVGSNSHISKKANGKSITRRRRREKRKRCTGRSGRAGKERQRGGVG